jgi:hypothetical protein
MKYPRPKLFKPSLEEQKSAAEKLSPFLSPSVALVLSNGSTVKGISRNTKRLKSIDMTKERQDVLLSIANNSVLAVFALMAIQSNKKINIS